MDEIDPAEEGRIYLTAVERYALDDAFRARVSRVKDAVMRAESYTPSEGAQVGMWIGVAMTLQLIEEGHQP